MMRCLTVSLFVMALYAARYAAADSFDDCLKDCAAVHTQCVEAITLFDETGIKEEKQLCADAQKECNEKCQADNAQGNQEAQEEKRRKEAEEAEKKQQEQQETINGNIKIYKFGD